VTLLVWRGVRLQIGVVSAWRLQRLKGYQQHNIQDHSDYGWFFYGIKSLPEVRDGAMSCFDWEYAAIEMSIDDRKAIKFQDLTDISVDWRVGEGSLESLESWEVVIYKDLETWEIGDWENWEGRDCRNRQFLHYLILCVFSVVSARSRPRYTYH